MEIQTRERAAGMSFHALQRIGLIRRMQTYTWAEMLENAAQLAGGRPPDRITVAVLVRRHALTVPGPRLG